MRQRAAVSALAIIAVIFSLGGILFAFEGTRESPDDGWSVLETGSISIYYKSGANLDLIESNLRKRAAYFSSDMPGDGAPVEEKIRYQLDALFRRAEDILGMRPADIHIKIKIFRDRKELNDEHIKIFDAAGEGLKAFYVDKYNTIYISEADISDSTMAHEMGHAIIDHYFTVIPPDSIRELLAEYVDLHLAD
ncbi:MAG: hypothetical protein Q7S07_01835 [Candidatus Omnitrophota bacterium]|nr:hypothetical protein [Candidatus Omnitrophota bacterium]